MLEAGKAFTAANRFVLQFLCHLLNS